MSKSVRAILLILCILWMRGMLSAQDPLVLRLEDCLQLALSQNPYHLASEERVEGAKSMVREARANFFPNLTGQGTQTLDEKLFELEFPSFIPGEPPQKVAVDFTRDTQFALNLSVPLFTGGRLMSGYKQAKHNYSAMQESARQSRQVTILETKRAFYGYLLAEEFVFVAREAVEVAEKLVNNVKSQYEVGLASKFDLLRTEVDLANLKPQLIRAKNNLKIAELGLKTLLGLDPARTIDLQGRLEFSPVEPQLAAALERALVNRPELNQLRYQKNMAGEMIKMAKAEFFPTVALAGNFNFWSDRLSLKRESWQDYYTINLVLSIPLFNGFATSARVAQSRAAAREIELTQKGLEDTIEFEVRQAVLKLEEAEESLLSQEKNVEQAEESLRIAELNYNEGLITTLDVSTAQAALSQAKINYSQALYDYMVAQAELERAVGSGDDE